MPKPKNNIKNTKNETNDKFLKHQFDLLIELKNKLSKRADSIVTFNKDGESQDDNARAAAEATTNLSLKGDMKRELTAIEKALNLFRKKKYGTCQKCGQQIEPGRLELVPTAIYCVTCQGKVRRR